MKKISVLTVEILILLTFCVAHAQTSAEAYLDQLPAAPGGACILPQADAKLYVKQVSDLKDNMDRDILQRQEDMQVYMNANRERIAARVARQAGSGARLSTKAQDPAIQDMLVEQKLLTERIEARKSPILKKLKAIDANAAAEKVKIIDPLHRQLSSMGGLVATKSQSAQMDEMARKLKEAIDNYCEIYTAQYIAQLKDYFDAVKASLPDYRRLEEINAKVQMGLDKPIDAGNGLMGLEAVRDYAILLSKSFKYNLPYEY